MQCDLREPDTIPAVVDRAKAELGTIDVPVNNAGTSWGASVTDYPDLDRRQAPLWSAGKQSRTDATESVRGLCKAPANRAFRTGPCTELTKSYY